MVLRTSSAPSSLLRSQLGLYDTHSPSSMNARPTRNNKADMGGGFNYLQQKRLVTRAHSNDLRRTYSRGSPIKSGQDALQFLLESVDRDLHLNNKPFNTRCSHHEKKPKKKDVAPISPKRSQASLSPIRRPLSLASRTTTPRKNSRHGGRHGNNSHGISMSKPTAPLLVTKRRKPRIQSGPSSAVQEIKTSRDLKATPTRGLIRDTSFKTIRQHTLERELIKANFPRTSPPPMHKRSKPRQQSGVAVQDITSPQALAQTPTRGLLRDVSWKKLLQDHKPKQRRKPRYQSGDAVGQIRNSKQLRQTPTRGWMPDISFRTIRRHTLERELLKIGFFDKTTKEEATNSKQQPQPPIQHRRKPRQQSGKAVQDIHNIQQLEHMANQKPFQLPIMIRDTSFKTIRRNSLERKLLQLPQFQQACDDGMVEARNPAA